MNGIGQTGDLAAPEGSERDYDYLRARMVSEQLRSRGIAHAGVILAMGRLPRHEFVPANQRALAYEDHPLPIGYGQTISQPFMVAFMTQALRPRNSDVVLEIGTGSGYQTAVLAGLVRQVHTVEIVEPLAASAKHRLENLGFTNATVHVGDGTHGWPEASPYDAVIVTCAPEDIPPALIEQLREDGRIIIPTGYADQQVLYIMTKREGRPEILETMPVRFVPMVSRELEP